MSYGGNMMAARAVIETTLADLESTCLPLTDRAIDKHWVEWEGLEPTHNSLRGCCSATELPIQRNKLEHAGCFGVKGLVRI